MSMPLYRLNGLRAAVVAELICCCGIGLLCSLSILVPLSKACHLIYFDNPTQVWHFIMFDAGHREVAICNFHLFVTAYLVRC